RPRRPPAAGQGRHGRRATHHADRRRRAEVSRPRGRLPACAGSRPGRSPRARLHRGPLPGSTRSGRAVVILGRAMVVGVALGALATVAGAQAGFRITHTVERGSGTQTRITGMGFNESSVDAVDVYVTAEAVDGSGKTVARGITFVSPSIAAGRGVAFTASVPAAPGATSYRVRVSSFRSGLAPQSP